MMQLHVMMRMLPFLLRHRAALGVQRLVDGCIRDPFLRRALAFHPLLIGGHPGAHAGAVLAHRRVRAPLGRALRGRRHRGARRRARGAARAPGRTHRVRGRGRAHPRRVGPRGRGAPRRRHPSGTPTSCLQRRSGVHLRPAARPPTAVWPAARLRAARPEHVAARAVLRRRPHVARHSARAPQPAADGRLAPRARPGVRAHAARTGEERRAADGGRPLPLRASAHPHRPDDRARAAARRCTCSSRHRRSTPTRRCRMPPRAGCAISWSMCSTSGTCRVCRRTSSSSTRSAPSTSAMC